MPKRDNRETYNAYMRTYMLRRYKRRRSMAIEKLGGECVQCRAIECLEIDHIDRGQKTIPLNKLWSISEKRFLAELEKCQLLCRECHQEKTLQESGLQRNKGVHGHPENYNRYGCRCEKCKTAWREYQRELRRKRKERKGSVA